MVLEHHQTALAKAEQAYNNLVCVFHEGVTAAHLLLDDKCIEASNYRGLLLGRPWGMGATFDELYLVRLKTDVTQARMAFDISHGRFTESSSVESMNHEQISIELRRIIDVILVPYPDDEKKRFGNKSVVNALFNVGKSQSKDVKYHLKDHQMSYILIRKMLDYCIGTCSSKRPVTLKVAKQAYTKFVGDPKGEKSPVIDLIKQTLEFGDKLEKLMANGYLDVQAGTSTPITSVFGQSHQ